MVSLPTAQDELLSVVDEPAVTHGNIVTSRKPDDVQQFTDALIALVERAPARAEAEATA